MLPSDVRAVQNVFLVTLGLNVAVALAKIVLSVLTGALSVLADGFHSLTDGSNNVVALVALRYAGRPADADHPYGHRRIETLAALGIGALLLLTAWEVLTGVFERVQGGAAPTVTPLTFVVLVATLVINMGVTAYQRREGKRLKSQLLMADAAHTGADVYVTLAVIGSMGLEALGLRGTDTIAALLVTAFIGKAALEILRETGGVLVDTAPHTPEKLTAVVERVPGVRVVRARSRGTPDAALIDVDVRVAADTTAEQTEALTEAIRAQLERDLGGVVEVEVHFLPDESAPRDYALLARRAGEPHGLTVHAVRRSEDATLELHVEVPGGETLETAHVRVSALEADLRARLPEIREVLTHIEPASAGDGSAAPTRCEALAADALTLLKASYPDVGWHQVRAYPQGAAFALTLHATLPPDITVEAAHHAAEQATTLIRARLRDVERVTIHTEPHDHA